MSTSTEVKLCKCCNQPRDSKEVMDNAIPDHCGECSFEIIRAKFEDKQELKRIINQIAGHRDPACDCALCIGAFN